MDYLDIDEEELEQGESNYRKERLARMKEEKIKQAAKRTMIRKMIPVAVIGIIAIAAVVAVLIWGIGKLRHKNEAQTVDIETQEVAEQEKTEFKTTVAEPIQAQAEPVMIQKEIVGMPEIAVEKPQMTEGYTVNLSTATSAVSEEDVQSTYATLINATTGDVLVSKNGTDRMYPASMTKVMTVLVACEHATELNQPCEILLEDTDYAYRHDLSNAGFEAGEIVPFKDILYGAIMPSGGECCHALERIVAGDEDSFIDMMNEKAAQLGLNSTHYTNSAGLFDENHYTTAVDMAMLMKAAIENDLCRQILHEHVYTTAATEFHPEGLELSNWFQRRIEDKYDRTEVMGAKTGYVSQAGNCAASYTVDNKGEVYICVTGQAHSAWRAIFDHVSLYNMYITE